MKREIKLATNCEFGRAGETVMLELTPADVHVPEELPNYLAGYKPPGFRADEASDVILVTKDTDHYRTFSEDDAFEPVNVKGSLTGPVPEIDTRSSTTTYKVVDRYIGSLIPTVVEAQANPNYKPRQRAAERCTRVIAMDREIDVWTQLGTNTTFAAAQRLALGAGENWNGGAASDPVKNIQTVQENSDQEVTDFWMNRLVANAFLRHDKVRDHMRQWMGDSAATGILKMAERANVSDFTIPGLGDFHVISGKYKPASTKQYFLGNVVVAITRTATPGDGEVVSTAKTFRRAGIANVGYDVEEFFVRGRGPKGGTMVVVSTADVPVITANNAGGHIAGVIA
jgi:hypothetical protein